MFQPVSRKRHTTFRCPVLNVYQAKHYGALRREHVLCPVTALSFYRAKDGRLFTLAGEDSHLKVYDVESSALCASLHVFRAQSIHGILVRSEGAFESGPKVLIWGGSSVTALSQDDIEDLLAGKPVKPPAEVQAPDWIYDGVLSPSEQSLGAIVTAHNEVIPLLFGADGRTIEFGRLRSPSRPILYSAKLAWSSASDNGLIVGAGTAFGEIVVWRCSLQDETASGCEIIHVFLGHEGSIFGVDITPELTLPGAARTRLLASCSDDRTIRVWDITELERGGEVGGDAVARAFSEARETGFGSSYENLAGSQYQSKPVAVVMSHLSRIWHVRFAIHTPELLEGEGLTLYSFGEDATTQRWRLDLKNPQYRKYLEQKTLHGVIPAETESLASLSQTAAYHSHSGKHIWSTAVQTGGSSLVVSGGADGMINMIGNPADVVDNSEIEEDSPMLSFSVSDVLKSLGITDAVTHSTANGTANTVTDPATSTKAKKAKRHKAVVDSFNQYAFLSDTQILTTTLSGKIFVCVLQGSTLDWSEVEVEDAIREDLASWQVVRSIGSGIALLGSRSGSVYVYDIQKIRKVAQVGGKVAAIFCLTDAEKSADTGLKVLVTALGRTQATLLNLKPLEDESVFSEAYIELDQGFIVTAATFCKEYLVLGSRFGSMLAYVPQSGAGFERIARREGQSRDAVASITSLPESASSAPPYFLTSCRDGRYRIYEISSSTGDVEVLLRHEASPPLGPMIEESFFVQGPDGHQELILCGFRSKEFVVWNETRCQEITSVECGGAHRAFTYRIDPQQPERLCFIWTKASQTFVYRQQRVSHKPLKTGGHGREIRAVSSCSKYLATGAEDTALRIWKYNVDDGKRGKDLRCLAVIEKHTAGIQSLKWLGDEYLVSSAGNEELHIWKVTTLQSAYEGLAVVCEAAYSDRTPDGDLRVVNFDVESVQETDATISSPRMYITLSLSNSTIKTYEYSTDNGFKLLSMGRYTGACMTQLQHLRMGQDGLHVLTAATDGHVAIWKTTEPSPAENQRLEDYRLVSTARIHQSTMKALDLRRRPKEPSSCFVVTGGDDDAIGAFHVSWDIKREVFAITNRSIVKSVHAAAITGISIAAMPDSAALVVTSSNDQRIKSWEMQLERGSKKPVALLGDKYSCVADTGDLELMPDGRLVIVGVGMEFWEIES